MTPTIVAILVYLVAQLALGMWLSRRISSESDYLVAGRQLGYGLATFSMFATWFGAETVISGAGRAHERGFSLSSPEPFGYGLCLLGMGLFFARPLWNRKLTTLADLFRQRYSVNVERLAALILIPSSILWAAAQVRAFGHVVATAAPGVSVEGALAAAAGFTILYTAFGGLLADAMTDFVQGILLIIGLVVVAVAVFIAAGGIHGVTTVLQHAQVARAALPSEPVNWLDISEAWAIPVCGSLIATELVGRVVGTRSATVAARSSLIASVMYVGVGLIPMFIGLVGGSLVNDVADPEQLVPMVALHLLPTFYYAIFAGGLISAILSTVDSTLLVASGIMSHNILVPVFRITNEKTKVRVARGGVVIFGIIAWILARGAEGVFALVEEASAFGSAGTLVTVCFGLFTDIGGARAAAATLVTGVLSYLVASTAEIPAPFLLSLLASLIVYPLVASTEPRQNSDVRFNRTQDVQNA